MKIEPYLSISQNLAPNKYLKLKPGTQNLIEEKTGNSLKLISTEERLSEQDSNSTDNKIKN